MEFGDQDEQEEMGLAPSCYSLENSSGVKLLGVEPGSITPTGQQQQQQQRKPSYRECLKNHAVGLGGHALDGCGEFMPAGTEGTLDALKCAACNCHRNFHRKETEPGSPNTFPTTDLYLHQPPQFTPYFRAPTGYLQVTGQQRLLALPSISGGGGGGKCREDQEDALNHGSSRKRFRTKFTQEQKMKMLELAERLGWRIQKHDEPVVQQFCNESGVKRQVFKVWMHNNKHTLGKKP